MTPPEEKDEYWGKSFPPFVSVAQHKLRFGEKVHLRQFAEISHDLESVGVVLFSGGFLARNPHFLKRPSGPF